LTNDRIEALGGANGVESRSDDIQGSIFWFTFPYRPCFDTIIGCKYPEESDADSTPYPRRILLIDDSPSVLKVTSRLLKMNSHTVETAIDGLIGLDRLKEAYDTQDIDMVITDLQMLVMDGIEATSRYRKFEDQQNKLRGESRRLLIVGVSASNDTQSKNEGLDSGMDHFLFKPFAYKDLIHILRSETLSSVRTSNDGDACSVRQPPNVEGMCQRSSTHELPSRMEVIKEDEIESGLSPAPFKRHSLH
jgi:CheY-like chemotaxis protein